MKLLLSLLTSLKLLLSSILVRFVNKPQNNIAIEIYSKYTQSFHETFIQTKDMHFIKQLVGI